MALLEKDQIRAQLPEIGERRLEHPTAFTCGPGGNVLPLVKPCTVVAVHVAHMWYTVRFDGSGIRETYKLPHVGLYEGGKL